MSILCTPLVECSVEWMNSHTFNSLSYIHYAEWFIVHNSQRFVVHLWSLWKHRNLKLCQEVSETFAQVIDHDVHLIDDWNFANDSLLATCIPRSAMHIVNNASLSSAMPYGVVYPCKWSHVNIRYTPCSMATATTGSCQMQYRRFFLRTFK